MASYRRFDRTELAAFLRALDDCLEGPAKLVVIGGGAAAIGYDVDVGTEDLDTCSSELAAIQKAASRARKQTGLHVPVSYAGVANFPWNYEDRLRREMTDLHKLELWVLEEHDLALSKTVRGDEHDFQQLSELHRRKGLDFETLMRRYLDEMGHVVGNPDRVRMNFVELVELLFGELKRVEAERRLSAAGH